MHTFNSTQSRIHALNKSSSSLVLCAFGIWVGKKRDCGSHSLSEWQVFLCFHWENVKVAAQGHYFDSEENAPLGWFKGRSNEMSYVLQMSYIKFMYRWYELYFGLWCDTVVAFFFFFYCMTLLYGKNTKCKAGKFAH